MSNNIYDQLNDIDFKVEDYEEENLSEMERKIMKKNIKNSLRGSKKNKSSKAKWISLAAGFGVFIVGLNSGWGQTVYGKAESKIREVSYGVSEMLGREKNLESYKNLVNKSVENKGIEVKLNEVLLDRDEIIISTVIEADHNYEGYHLDDQLFINGKAVKDLSKSGFSQALGDSIYGEVSSLNIGGIDLDEELEIDYRIRSISFTEGEKTKKIKGPWDFKFRADGLELMKDTKDYQIGEKFEIEGIDYFIDKIFVNKINSKIYGRRSDLKSYDIDLVGLSNKGEEVKFYNNIANKEDLTFKQATSVDLSEVDYIDFKVNYRELPEKSGRIDTEFKTLDKTFRINLK